MCCKMFWKFCEIWKILLELASYGPNSMRFYLTVWDMACMLIYFQLQQQYVFIHDCLNEMIERKRRALMERDTIYVNQAFG